MKKIYLLLLLVLLAGARTGQAAVYTVTSLANSGLGTYRAAVDSANLNVSLDTISFSVTGQIVLSAPQVQVWYPTCIMGPGANLLTIRTTGVSCIELMGWWSGKSYISGLTLRDGTTTGGGIHNMVMADTVYISDCVIKKGAVPSPGTGGGIQCGNDSRTVMTNVLIDSCSAGTGAGISTGGNIYLRVINSTISNCSVNYTAGGGAALDAASGKIELVNTTFYNNTVQNFAQQSGGAVRVMPNFGTSVLSIVNCTFRNNYAINGANIWLEANGNTINMISTNTIYDCTNWSFPGYGNSAGTVTALSNGSNISSDNSMSAFLVAVGDLNNVNPLANNATANTCNRPICSLQVGSPALNAANPTFAPATDECGTPRGTMPDIGAYEACTSTSSTQSVSACFSYTSPSGNYTWSSSGTYLDTIPNGTGCDSIITINLTVGTVDTSVTQNGITLTASAVGATYQWLDCSAAMGALSGEISQTFTATNNGSYAVSVTQNGCTDTSACYNVNSVGLAPTGVLYDVQVFPNPARGKLFVRAMSSESMLIEVVNSIGCSVLSTTLAGRNNEIDLAGIPPGVYQMKITSGGKVFLGKIVIL